MDKKAVLAILSDFKKAIESVGVRPQKMILFGSYAQGSQRPDSDIDIVVISEDFEKKSYWERIDILSAAVFKVFKPIEAVAMTQREWDAGDSMICNYARNGEVVYSQK
jgi:predicted nucleotidyltransferase